MRALTLEAQGKVLWYNAPRPELTSYGAILRPVAVAPCSSDVHLVFGGGSIKDPHLILGHECVAEIIKIGHEVCDFSVGEIVAVPAITPNWRSLSIQEHNFKHAGLPFSGHQLGRTKPGVFAEEFLISDADTTLAKIPDGVSIEQALMCVDVMTTGLTGVENANILFGDSVCVIGIGPIGLMAIAGARLQGAAQLFAVGSRSCCVEAAYSYGATQVINYHEQNIVDNVKDLTNGCGVDAVIICGGDDEVFEQAFDMVRYGIGRVSNVNYFGGYGSLSFPKFSGGRGMAGKTLYTDLASGGRVRIERMMKLVQFGRIDPARLVTHRFMGMDGIESALNAMKDKIPNLIKPVVLIDWSLETPWSNSN